MTVNDEYITIFVLHLPKKVLIYVDTLILLPEFHIDNEKQLCLWKYISILFLHIT